MKKLLAIILIMILAISGCQSGDEEESLTPDDIITFDEVIEDGQVEIDGISYSVESVSRSTFQYDNNGNIIERTNENKDNIVRTEFTYNENNDVLEEKNYSEGDLIATRSYSYEEDALKEVKIAYESGFEMLTEYSYEEDKEIVTSYNTDGSVALTAIIYKDENGNNSKMVQSCPEVEKLKATTNYEHENDLLMKSTTERNDTNTTVYYEYNNVGDKIFEYNITTVDDLCFLDVTFFEYEYNDDLQPVSLTTYRVHTPIEEEDIRKFD